MKAVCVVVGLMCAISGVAGGCCGGGTCKPKPKPKPKRFEIRAAGDDMKTLKLEKQILRELDEADAQMDKYYKMKKYDAIENKDFFEDVLRKSRRDLRTTFADFLDTLQAKMNENAGLVEKMLEENIKKASANNKGEFDDFVVLLKKYIEGERATRKRMENIKKKLGELLGYFAKKIGSEEAEVDVLRDAVKLVKK
ncbi:MAG: uncharacterized protein A8A55_1781 [Amphiamblys sp. WSBS2006]|nr:MAG: uncharacterized protein A8A55_1781 [Amphiamblys sp. WSBS2006]